VKALSANKLLGLRRTATVALLFIAWWGAGVFYAAARGTLTEQPAKWLAEQTALMIPVGDVFQGVWPPSLTREGGISLTWQDVTSVWPWMIFNDMPVGLILPFHAACCALIVWALHRWGFPRITINRSIAVQTFWKSLAWGAFWLVFSVFVSRYWFFASNPAHVMRGTPPLMMTPLIDISVVSLNMPLWGSLLGYVASVIHEARKNIWKSQNLAHHSPPEWCHTCMKCGYEAASDRPCPECGEPDPLSVGMIYFNQSHARLTRGRRFDPVRALLAILISLLCIWPLLSGALR
jgi:hypothetical protein